MESNDYNRISIELSDLYDKVGTLEIKNTSLSSNLNLLIKILSGSVILAASMLGSIYLSVAKIDKQVAMIATTVNKSNQDQIKLELRVNKLEDTSSSLLVSCQEVKSNIQYLNRINNNNN